MIWPPQGALSHDDHVVDGWHLEQDDDRDDDVVKIWHEAVHEDGRRVTLDWSPYRNIGREDFERLVRLGFPSRSAVQSIGPLNSDDLTKLVEARAKEVGLSPEEVERLWGEQVGKITSDE